MIAACTLCRRIFNGPSASALYDARAQNALARFLVELAKHIQENHADVTSQVDVSTLQYRGFLMMGYYNVTGDDLLVKEREQTRRYLHFSTRKVIVSNDELRVKAAEMTGELDLDISACADQAENRIYAALVELRDRLCEIEHEPVKLTV